MDTLVLLISVLVFLAIVVAVLALRPARREELTPERLRSLRTGSGSAAPGGWGTPLALRQTRFSRIRLLNRILSTTGSAESMALDLERADVALKVGEYLMLRVATGVILAAIGFMALPIPLLAVPLAAVGFMLPAWYIAYLRRRRLRKMGDQLEEMVTIMAGALKSGYGFLQSIDFAAQQLPPPLSDELRRLLRDANLGTSVDDAMNDLLDRVPLYDLDIIITAINIQRTVGGNLAEILENVGFTIRERKRIQGEIRTLTAQQRLSAYVIALMPIVMGLAFTLMNAEYMSLLISRSLGLIMIGAAAVLWFVGIFLIRRIVDIEV